MGAMQEAGSFDLTELLWGDIIAQATPRKRGQGVRTIDGRTGRVVRVVQTLAGGERVYRVRWDTDGAHTSILGRDLRADA